ncbi:MAG: hypothetical protein ACI8S6_001836 [Myxococcota bacterium]|jgi:hypothetical protein
MTAEQLRDLARDLELLSPEEAWPFVFTPRGPDGFPSLIVRRKRIPPDQIRDLLRWTPHTTLVRGLVVRAPDGVLLFDAPGVSEEWKTQLRAFFGPYVPDLTDAE